MGRNKLPNELERVRGYKRKYKIKQRKINLDYCNNYKITNGCSSCGLHDSCPRIFDFHHKRDKKYLISKMIGYAYSLSSIQFEIEKCVVLCSNCHRIKHYTNGFYNNKKGRFLSRKKQLLKCKLCDFSDHRCLDFHHLGDKHDNLGALVRNKGCSFAQFVREYHKCIPVCSNCHRKLHSK